MTKGRDAASRRLAAGPAELPPDLLPSVLGRLPVPLCLRDRNSTYVWINDAFQAAFGRPAAEVLGKTDFDLLAVEQAQLERARDRRVFEEGRDVFFEERDHSPRTLLGVSGWHIAIPGDGLEVRYVLRQWGTVGGGRPQERSLAASLLPERSALDRALNLGQLAGALAHQLRNPLCAISNAIAVLRRPLSEYPSANVQEALTIAADEVWAANRIIADLLAFSKVGPASPQTASFSAIVQNALSRDAGEPAPILREPPGELLVHVDPGQTAEALANLIRCARESAVAPTRLTIGWRAEALSVVIVVLAARRTPGTEQLFASVSRSQDGAMSVGLTTARALLENQGGSLLQDAQQGDGVRFVVRFPHVATSGPGE